MTISKDLLDELLKGCERHEDLLGDAGLMKELKIKLMEQMGSVQNLSHFVSCDGGSVVLKFHFMKWFHGHIFSCAPLGSCNVT